MQFRLVLLLFLFLPLLAQAQDGYTVRGRVLEAENGSPMPGVNVGFNLENDDAQYGSITDGRGFFTVEIPGAGSYTFQYSFVGYVTFKGTIEVTRSGQRLSPVRLEKEIVNLDQIVVEDRAQRVIVKDDTTEYNADAFKVNPDANAEDLLAKMPGVVVEDGTVQAQGEDVRRVLVDGREFFGNDPQAALRNLPAEIIERIQVFDRMSDQAQFTGFDDGNSEKTINIITRPGMSNGQFGKIYGGYGSEDRYIGGGNINIFNGDQRISLIGLSNNVNQQNFATEDLLGVIGNTGRRGGGFRGGPGMRDGGGARPGGGGGRGFGGGGMRDGARPGGANMALRSNPQNFLVGNQGGVNQTHAVGLNYSDRWGDQFQIAGSYFFNMSNNLSDVFLDREYYLTDASSQFYNETNTSESDNYNHRVSLRMQYQFDDRNSLIFTPNISFQNNEALSELVGFNTLEGALLSTTSNDYLSNNQGFTSTSRLLYRHRLPKEGRTLSANLSIGLNDRSGDAELLAANNFYDTIDSLLIVNQQTNTAQNGQTYSFNLAYTEPVGSNGQLMFNYSPSISNSDAEQLTNGLDAIAATYTVLDPTLSSLYESRTVRQRGGVNFMRRGERGMLSFGVDVQDESLSGDQTFPIAFGTDRSFQSLLPRAMFQLRFDRQENLRVFYRTFTNTPSISQLQSVIDNTNPLQLSSGNPDLEQSYSHMLVARYNKTNVLAGRLFMGFVSVNRFSNTIGTESIVAIADTMLEGNVLLAQGSTYSRPVNLNRSWNVRSFMTLGTPLDLLRSNLNFNAGYTYTHTPGIINEVENISDVHGLNGGAVLGSTISEKVDFTLSYSLNGSRVRNSVYPELDADYLYHKASGKVNILLNDSWVINTDLNLIQFSGLSDSFDQNSVLWNAGIGYKFLRGNGGEVRLVMSDILNQNTSIVRTVNELYVEDNRSNVLGRYLILNLTYKLRHFRM